MPGGFGRIPGVKSVTITPVQVRKTGRGAEQARDIVVDSALTDSGSTPTSRIRPGQVLVLRTSTGRYEAANSATGDRNTAAAATSLIDISAWSTGSKTFKWSYKGGGTQTVTGTSGDAVADVVTDLNADPDFSADLVASASASKLVITARRAGSEEWFTIKDGTLNDVGGAEATFADNTDHAGTDAKYRVLDDFLDMVDVNNAAVHAIAVGYPVGDFVEANLRNLTSEARHVLRAAGSIFY